MADEARCPNCYSRLLSGQLLLTETRDSFPQLGRELTKTTPKRSFLEVMTCASDGSSWARWADRPDDPLRRLDHRDLKHLAWDDDRVDFPPIIRRDD